MRQKIYYNLHIIFITVKIQFNFILFQFKINFDFIYYKKTEIVIIIIYNDFKRKTSVNAACLVIFEKTCLKTNRIKYKL